MPILSIIIPVYNAENHLKKCVDSLTVQTYKNLEIILVNDGSTDGSAALCDVLAKKGNHIKVIHQTHNGISAARNTGIDAATGEYMIFADTNSIFAEDILEKCMNEIAAHSPDLLACAIPAPSDDKRSKIYIEGNMYTRNEYAETVSRYISTGIGFKYVTNKIFRAEIIKRFSLYFPADVPLVAAELFNCRFFKVCGHIRCVSDLLCIHTADGLLPTEGTTGYLAQGKIYSQKLIDAVQSKGLYGSASQAISENYQKILYRHLVLLALPNSNCSTEERLNALDELSKTGDSAPLMLYLSTLTGIKNRYIYEMYKLRQWRLLLNILGK